MSSQGSPLRLKSVREWLGDYFAKIEGTSLDQILTMTATCQVESAMEARALVNRRINVMILWLDRGRPASPSDPETR
jgi:hypothetical protein